MIHFVFAEFVHASQGQLPLRSTHGPCEDTDDEADAALDEQ